MIDAVVAAALSERCRTAQQNWSRWFSKRKTQVLEFRRFSEKMLGLTQKMHGGKGKSL